MARRVGEERARALVDWRERIFFSRTRRKREERANQLLLPLSPFPPRSPPLTCIAATAMAASANRPVSLWASMSFVFLGDIEYPYFS